MQKFPFLMLFFALLVEWVVWPIRSDSGEMNDIALSLRTDRTVYRVGQRIALTLTITNRGGQPQRLTFPSAQVYDFVVRQDGREVWRWSRDRMFAMMLTELRLLPGKPQSYTVHWGQIDTESRLVPPGTYEVVGLLVGQSPDLSRSLRIIIQPPSRTR